MTHVVMKGDGEAIALAAAALIGTKFRLHGRDPRFGLDCVGLVACAFADAGRPAVAPANYALRNNDISDALLFADMAGLAICSDAILPGDVVLAKPGPAQFHLAIKGADAGFIHAHAGLRKIVSVPAPLPWPIIRHWRAQSDF